MKGMQAVCLGPRNALKSPPHYQNHPWIGEKKEMPLKVERSFNQCLFNAQHVDGYFLFCMKVWSCFPLHCLSAGLRPRPQMAKPQRPSFPERAHKSRLILAPRCFLLPLILFPLLQQGDEERESKEQCESQFYLARRWGAIQSHL